MQYTGSSLNSIPFIFASPFYVDQNTGLITVNANAAKGTFDIIITATIQSTPTAISSS